MSRFKKQRSLTSHDYSLEIISSQFNYTATVLLVNRDLRICSRICSFTSFWLIDSDTFETPNDTVRFKESNSRTNHSDRCSTDSLKRSNSTTIRSQTGHRRFLSPSLSLPQSMAVDLYRRIPRLISVVATQNCAFIMIIVKIPLFPRHRRSIKMFSNVTSFSHTNRFHL